MISKWKQSSLSFPPLLIDSYAISSLDSTKTLSYIQKQNSADTSPLPGTKKVGLAFESTKSTSPTKQADAVLNTLQELKGLSVSEQNAQRANLFNKLVTELRGLSDEAVASLLPQLIGVSR